MDQPHQTQPDETDQIAIDRAVQIFFEAFCNRGQRTPRFDELRELFTVDAVIAKRNGDSTQIMSVDAFIEPRRALLGSGALTEFSEWETGSETLILGGIACRWSTYEKSGFMHGAPYGGVGKKIFSFIHAADGWKIVSAMWEDES